MLVHFKSSAKGMVHHNFSSGGQKFSKLQPYKVAIAEKLICTETIWEETYRRLNKQS